MAKGAPDPVETWAPIFTPYFKDEQLLKSEFVVVLGNYCKFCDCRIAGRADKHVKMHARELEAWRKRRGKEADKNRQAGLDEYRREQKAIKEMLDDDDD